MLLITTLVSVTWYRSYAHIPHSYAEYALPWAACCELTKQMTWSNWRRADICGVYGLPWCTYSFRVVFEISKTSGGAKQGLAPRVFNICTLRIQSRPKILCFGDGSWILAGWVHIRPFLGEKEALLTFIGGQTGCVFLGQAWVICVFQRCILSIPVRIFVHFRRKTKHKIKKYYIFIRIYDVWRAEWHITSV